MSMTPNIRKFLLTSHITFSVGWIGAVGAFLALAIAGLNSRDEQVVRASYLAMDLTTWFVIVPLAIAALLTGIVSSVGTKWGLLRHYWVTLKLLITVACIAILLVHTQPLGVLADAAGKMAALGADLQASRILMVVASSAALPVLLLLTALSVYKLRGMTPYGVRGQGVAGAESGGESRIGTPRWVKVFGVVSIVVFLVFVISHLDCTGLGGLTLGH